MRKANLLKTYFDNKNVLLTKNFLTKTSELFRFRDIHQAIGDSSPLEKKRMEKTVS